MKLIPVFIAFILITACTQKTTNEKTRSGFRKTDTATRDLVADTIIYDVVIRNTNPYDTWIEKSLGRLQHRKLIDSIFALVYEKKIKAYDYFSNEEMSINQVKELENEEGFSRDRIGKMQFTESWYFDKSTETLQKEVISIALGHELYTNSGEFRGYKPVFKLYLNP